MMMMMVMMVMMMMMAAMGTLMLLLPLQLLMPVLLWLLVQESRAPLTLIGLGPGYWYIHLYIHISE